LVPAMFPNDIGKSSVRQKKSISESIWYWYALITNTVKICFHQIFQSALELAIGFGVSAGPPLGSVLFSVRRNSQ
jgi:hypothetical protein